MRRELPPRGARHEQQRERDRHVHHARAKVGLDDHEQRGHERREHHARGRAGLLHVTRAVDHERGEREYQQHLADLGRLEGEQREFDRPLRAPARFCARARARRGCSGSGPRRCRTSSGASASSRYARAPPSRRARRSGRSPGGRRSSAACPARDFAVAARNVTIEQTPRPIAASVSRGSSGSRRARAS